MGSANAFPFRRLTNPLILTIAPTAQRFDVPAGFFQRGGPAYGVTSFLLVNPQNMWIRLIGSTDQNDGGYVAVTDTTGWLFPPNFWGVMTTQYPQYMSVMSIARSGLTAGSGTVEVSYGAGV